MITMGLPKLFKNVAAHDQWRARERDMKDPRKAARIRAQAKKDTAKALAEGTKKGWWA